MNRLVAALPVALLLLSGCSDGDSMDAVGSGPTRAEYLKQVEPICKKANADVEALPRPTSPAGFQTLVEQTVALAEKATQDFKAVEQPAADKADIEAKVLTPLEAQVQEAKAFLVKVKAAVAKNDQAELGALLQSPPITTKADVDWMKSFGFKDCLEVVEVE